MGNLWERFNNIASADEVLEAKSKFAPLTAGTYKVKLEKLKADQNKDGLPMIKGQFRTVEGNRVIFYNQQLQNLNYPDMTAVNIGKAVAFLSALTGEDIEFTNLGALADKIATIPKETFHTVAVSYKEKDIEQKWPELKIVADEVEVSDSDVPFN